MLPIVTPSEMNAIDASASDSVDVLITRAGSAVARAAVRMLGGTYGRTVVVIAGPGNNGADGRVAASMLAARGVRVQVLDVADLAGDMPDEIVGADLVIDAAYGSGFHGEWHPPDVGDTPVLAVDIPSGVDALTGESPGSVLAATRTVTFAAIKPGLLVPPGSELAGELQVADIGLDVTNAHAYLVQHSDVARWWPLRAADAHKWRWSVRVVAGSATMTGAATLVAHAALRSGAGMVQVSVPGRVAAGMPVEVVQRELPATGWATNALGSLDRFRSLVVGPGLGRSDDTAEQTRQLAIESPLPTVIDGDGLFALAWNAQGAAVLLRKRRAATVITPHDGEYAVLTGAPPDADRLVAARRLAADTGTVVLLKGPATVVADPDGRTLVITAGDPRLATAGTGDVLAGILGALLAARVPAFEAAAAAAWVHGRAARLAPSAGMVASDIPDHIPTVVQGFE